MCNVQVWRIKSFNESIQSKIVEPATYRSSLHRKRELSSETIIFSKDLCFCDIFETPIQSMLKNTRNSANLDLKLNCFINIVFYCWFSHDVTKFQTSELLILLRFYFHDVLKQLKTNIQTNFHSEWVLGLVIDHAWISKLLRDVAFTWRARELLCWFKRWLISGNSAIWTVLVLA